MAKMTKQQRVNNLEERIGQLEVHIRKDCTLRALGPEDIEKMTDAELDDAIAERMAWLKENHEKERMGRGRY